MPTFATHSKFLKVEYKHQDNMRKLFLSLFMVLAVTTVSAQDDVSKHNFDVAKNIETFNAIYKTLDMMYVDTLNADETVGYGINSMLRSLDPYTVYYPEDKSKDFDMMLSGKYAGIGAIIRYNLAIGNVVIDEPYKDMPAAEAGLRKGDIILAIDDSTTVGKDVSYVSSHLRGEAGTSFILTYKRPATGKTIKKKITRKAIQLPTVPYYGLQDNGVGYLNLNQFTEGSAREVRRDFIEMKDKGMKAFVLDLRGNGGGLLNEAVSIVNMFVPKDISIVKTKGKIRQVNRDYRTTVEPIDTVMPIVVLVNGETASASEIVSGSLQDLDRAVVLGTRTYGKGIVQTTLDMPYNGQLKLTTSRYYIPSGRCIQAINYKHANGGSTEQVADSLTHVFHTVGGREVRDGAGIKPDVEVRPDSLPNIAYYLAGTGRDSSEVMLNWELKYIKNHSTIAPAKDFHLTDADYADFKKDVLASKFKYDGETEKYLKQLVKLAKFEGYYDGAKPEFDAIEKKLKHDVGKDLDYNEKLIRPLIEADLVAVYYYQGGSVENSLRNDKQYKAAIDLLQDEPRYNGILHPTANE